MKSTHTRRLVMPVIAHTVAAVLVLALSASYGGPGQTGVTNKQPASGLAPGQCLSHASACVANTDCCSQFCANGRCATQQP